MCHRIKRIIWELGACSLLEAFPQPLLGFFSQTLLVVLEPHLLFHVAVVVLSQIVFAVPVGFYLNEQTFLLCLVFLIQVVFVLSLGIYLPQRYFPEPQMRQLM